MRPLIPLSTGRSNNSKRPHPSFDKETSLDLEALVQGVVEGARQRTGLCDTDWQLIASVSETTINWSRDVGDVYQQALLGESETTEAIRGVDGMEPKQAFTVWFERVASGAPGATFWAETCLTGFAHASASIDNGSVITAYGRVNDELLRRTLAAFEPELALKVYGAFRKILDVALAVIVDSHVHALMTGMEQIGLNERLQKRMRVVAISKMIDAGRDSIPLMTWDDALSVRIDAIDEQHKKLIELLNRLHESKATKRGNATLRKILKELIDYTVYHFAFEEKLFDKYRYEDAAEHTASHRRLESQVLEFAKAFEAGSASLSADLFLFLRGWLNGHIRGSDREYAPYLAEKMKSSA